jgi:hypothetical protein
MEARCDSDHVRLLSFAPDAFTWAAQSHAFLDDLIIDAYAAWHPFQQGPYAWTMAGAKQGHREPLAKTHAHGARVALGDLPFNRCLWRSASL